MSSSSSKGLFACCCLAVMSATSAFHIIRPTPSSSSSSSSTVIVGGSHLPPFPRRRSSSSPPSSRPPRRHGDYDDVSYEGGDDNFFVPSSGCLNRRSVIASSIISPPSLLLLLPLPVLGTLSSIDPSRDVASAAAATAGDAGTTTTIVPNDDMYSPKFVQTYDDFIPTTEGWSYKDVKVGGGGGGGGGGETSAVPHKDGDRVVYDWSGYTIGYFGRPFEAKGGPQGGAFDKDLDYFRTVLGSNTIIPGLDSALRTMKVGGIRQVIVPYGPLSYPSGVDRDHDAIGPKPTTFSGMRALNFVLENPRVDRTLLFNLKLIRVDRGDGKGGFIRGGS